MPVTLRDAPSFGLREAEDRLRTHFGVAAVEGLGLPRRGGALRAAGAVLGYLQETQQAPLGHLARIQILAVEDHLTLDEGAARNLELVESLQDRGGTRDAPRAMDRTRTSMGGRLLRSGSSGRSSGRARSASGSTRSARAGGIAVAPRRSPPGARGHRRPRPPGRAASALGVATPRDLAAVRATLALLPALREQAERCPDPLIRQCTEAVEDLGDLRKTLEAALVDEPPLTLHEGGLIRESWNPGSASSGGRCGRRAPGSRGSRDGSASARASDRLRVRYNRVFGYGIEIPKSQVRSLPDEYVRRQTLVGAERYVTTELREQEAKVLGAESRMSRLEYELFDELRRSVAGEADRLLRSAHAVATLDVLAAFGHVGARARLRPALGRRRGRHRHPGRPPPGAGAEDATARRFVPNDLHLASGEVECLVITGPEHGREIDVHAAGGADRAARPGGQLRAGRSARVGVVDRVFTRIGARTTWRAARARSSSR